jgi:hypothetical protein
MKTARLPRWAISFADLALLLLAFFVLLHAGSAREVAAGARAAFGSGPVAGPVMDAEAERLFEHGEARLRPSAKAQLLKIGRGARGFLVVESVGRDPTARRFDAWELAAARAAALGRALVQGGVAEERIEIVLLRNDVRRVQGQRLAIRSR